MKNTVATVPIIPHFVLLSSFISGLISGLTSSRPLVWLVSWLFLLHFRLSVDQDHNKLGPSHT